MLKYIIYLWLICAFIVVSVETKRNKNSHFSFFVVCGVFSPFLIFSYIVSYITLGSFYISDKEEDNKDK